MKLQKGQKILLALAVAAYVGFLASFLLQSPWGMFGCGVAAGLFFLLILATAVPEEADPYMEAELRTAAAEEDRPRVHVDSLIEQAADSRERAEQSQKELDETKRQMESLEREAEVYGRQIDKLLEDKEKLSAQLADARAQLDEKKNEAQTAAAAAPKPVLPLSTILPIGDQAEPEVIDLAEAARSAVKDFSALAEKAGIHVHVVSPEESLKVKADRRMLDILFKNIIDNAIKYMNREGTLQITISEVGEDLFVVCKDNGEGLAAQETEHIFELNYQGSNRISGNGLGLAQARAIVEYYGGMIYARSTEGSGMGIYIHLPAQA